MAGRLLHTHRVARMQRRVRAAATDTARAGGAIKAEKGKGKGRGKQGADGNNQARWAGVAHQLQPVHCGREARRQHMETMSAWQA